MKATELLQADHRAVEALFADCQKAPTSQKLALLDELRSLLEVHAQLEEEIFYPALQQLVARSGDESVAEAYDEHKQVKDLLIALATRKPGDADFQNMLDELEDSVEDHVEEEEEVLFVKAEEMGEVKLEELGRRMEARRKEIALELVAG
jgi:iron-sulfur cluster repair protein YtfE (RIC family)